MRFQCSVCGQSQIGLAILLGGVVAPPSLDRSDMHPASGTIDATREAGRLVGSGTGAPSLGSGGSSLPFAWVLSPAPMPTFPVPAHRTGRAVFPHPALRRDHALRTRKARIRPVRWKQRLLPPLISRNLHKPRYASSVPSQATSTSPKARARSQGQHPHVQCAAQVLP